MSTVVSPPNAASFLPPVQYDVNDAEIADMKKTLTGLTADTPKDYQMVVHGIADCRDARMKVERCRKASKEVSLAWGRKVDTEAKRLTAAILEIEEPLKATKQAVDDEKARVKREKEEAERAKIEEELRLKREAEEAEAARVKAEKEAAEKAERDRIAAEQKIEAERLAAERAKLEEERAAADKARAEAEAEMKRQQAIIDEQNRIRQAKLDEEAALVKAEQERLDRIRFEQEAKEKAERDAREKAEREAAAAKAKAEAEEAERVRQEAQRPDKEKLSSLATKLAHMEFPDVATEEAEVVLGQVNEILLRAAKVLTDYCEA